MYEKLSQSDNDESIRANVAFGEAMAEAMMRSAIELCKISHSSRDNSEIAFDVASAVDNFAAQAFDSDIFREIPDEVHFKVSNYYPRLVAFSDRISRFEDGVVIEDVDGSVSYNEPMSKFAQADPSAARQMIELENVRSKESNFFRGAAAGFAGDRDWSMAGVPRLPHYGGSYSDMSDFFNPVAGLTKMDPAKLDPTNRRHMALRAMSPKLRAAAGVYFPGDEAELLKDFKPKPRTMHEAIALGMRDARSDVNNPGRLRRARMAIARLDTRLGAADRIRSNDIRRGFGESMMELGRERSLSDRAGRSAGRAARTISDAVSRGLSAGLGAVSSGAGGVGAHLARNQNRYLLGGLGALGGAAYLWDRERDRVVSAGRDSARSAPRSVGTQINLNSIRGLPLNPLLMPAMQASPMPDSVPPVDATDVGEL